MCWRVTPARLAQEFSRHVRVTPIRKTGHTVVYGGGSDSPEWSEMDTPTTRDNVRRYLRAAYVVDDELLDTIMASPEAKEHIDRGKNDLSFAYWPGDKIASHFDLVENPDYEDPDYEEEDE